MSLQWTPNGEIENGTHYKVVGPEDSTDIVCCIHGIGSYHAKFDELGSFLSSAGFKVVQYDLIGRGHSSNHKSEKFGAEEHLEQLHTLITKTLKISVPIHLIAHSMGGALAALYANNYPQAIKSLVLLAPAGLMDPGPLPLIRNVSCIAGIAKSVLKPRETQHKNWRNDFHNHTELFLEREEEMVRSMSLMYDNNPGAFEAFWRSVLEFPLYGLGEQVGQLAQHDHLSVFVMWGKEDIAVPFKPSFARWQSALEGQKCAFSSKVLDKAGHGFLLEYPEQTHKDILSFLNSTKDSALPGHL